MDKSRRNLLKMIALATVAAPVSAITSLNSTNASTDASSTFRYIYENPTYRNEFYTFLVNVFHLYPEDILHDLIAEMSDKYASDEEIYKILQNKIPEIKPFLSELSFSVPALRKQKKEMANQTNNLLGVTRTYEGYLEVGSTGRYVDALEEMLDIKGERFFVAEKAPNNSPQDIIDRGQLSKAGDYISLDNYNTPIAKKIPANSIDLATVYIGFHHCPIKLREEFISSIRDTMKLGASLILRDHDAKNVKMLNMVALAHDVFNMGTNESWEYNNSELRNFYSLDTLDLMLNKYGFKSNGKRIYQQGDPTLNALMLYKKV